MEEPDTLGMRPKPASEPRRSASREVSRVKRAQDQVLFPKTDF